MTSEDVPDGPLVVVTDVASFIHGGHDRGAPFKPLLTDHVLCLSFATVGELWAMVEIAKWRSARRQGLEAFIRNVLPADREVTMCWSRIHAAVRDQVDQNDEWIAASALAQAEPLPVVTGNLKHFQAIATRFPALVLVHPDL